MFSRVVLGWRKVQQEGDREDRDEYLDKHVLSRAGLRFINGQFESHTVIQAVSLWESPFYKHIPPITGLISQFSENLEEAGLVSHAKACQNNSSLYNEHSDQDELLKAVLLAGLYPNLIQVSGSK